MNEENAQYIDKDTGEFLVEKETAHLEQSY